MWAALREEFHPKGFELVTVGLDVLGAEGCRAFIEAANPRHPSLLDPHHQLADRFGITNIPQSIWIDESFRIVRPPEAAPAPPKPDRGINVAMPDEVPDRFRLMMAEAAKIPSSGAEYHSALRDWVEKGSNSRFALEPEEVIRRSEPRGLGVAEGHAHFELATWLEARGNHAAAVPHFRRAHELVPNSWTFRRQAWSLETVPEAGPLARFWQGPKPGQEADWPYEGGWLEDIQREGAENYNGGFQP
ncbi:MAG: hypothetical protein MK142_02265 [Pseudomonadales bacterium]|nr:hypothetical protein [Pseudomonadales bacterium]